MKTLITITRAYTRELNFFVDPKLIEGMSPEEIGEYLTTHYSIPEDKEELLTHQELETVNFSDIAAIAEIGEDRYDVLNKAGKSVYGGHL